jgi:phage tail sheath protein FI
MIMPQNGGLKTLFTFNTDGLSPLTNRENWLHSRSVAVPRMRNGRAGLDAALNGIHSLQVNLTNEANGQLNPLGINCLRSFPVNRRVMWGGRTLRGANQLVNEYKYIPVRRLALFIEECLYRGTQWVVFEPNDGPLWAQIRLNVGAFMHTLFRQGAFQGDSPRAAYFVKCDKETTTQTVTSTPASSTFSLALRRSSRPNL